MRYIQRNGIWQQDRVLADLVNPAGAPFGPAIPANTSIETSTFDFRGFKQIYLLMRFTGTVGDSLTIMLQPVDSAGNKITYQPRNIPMTFAVDPFSEINYYDGPEDPRNGYWDQFGIANGGYATSVGWMAPYGFRIVLVAPGNAGDVTIDTLDLSFRS